MENQKLNEVEALLAKIQDICDRRGLTLSRWQTNSRRHGFVESIVYKAHTGPRTRRSLDQTGVVGSAGLSQYPGTTSRCEAYREFSEMIEELEGLSE